MIKRLKRLKEIQEQEKELKREKRALLSEVDRELLAEILKENVSALKHGYDSSFDGRLYCFEIKTIGDLLDISKTIDDFAFHIIAPPSYKDWLQTILDKIAQSYAPQES